MSALYNFVKAGTSTFLTSPSNMEVVVSMCKTVLSGDPGEDPQVHACKLLEVILLECRDSIDSVSGEDMGGGGGGVGSRGRVGY